MWVGAVCVVLPFAIYIKYIDLEATLGAKFQGVGICYVTIEKRIEEYIRALFVTLYAMPLAIIAFLFVRISAELKSREATSISIHFASENPGSTAATAARELIDHAYRASGSWSGPHVAGSMGTGSSSSRLEVSAPLSVTEDTQHRSHHHHHSRSHHHHISHVGGGTSLKPGESPGSGSRDSAVRFKPYPSERSTHDSDDDLDLAKEKRTQNYLITMTTVFAMCWCPLHILILVNYFVHENDDNEQSYDITYITFTWFGFLSTCTAPVLFASWRMSSATKDRLRGYFRFSNRRHSTGQVKHFVAIVY